MKQQKSASFNFGQRIRALRVQRGLSQEELALRAGITPAYLGMVERGEKNPTLLTVEKVCNALGISLEQCFSQEQGPEPDNISEQILFLLRGMDEQEKHAVLKIVEQICRLQQLAQQRIPDSFPDKENP